MHNIFNTPLCPLQLNTEYDPQAEGLVSRMVTGTESGPMTESHLQHQQFIHPVSVIGVGEKPGGTNKRVHTESGAESPDESGAHGGATHPHI